mgnify:CR=1 FL=1
MRGVAWGVAILASLGLGAAVGAFLTLVAVFYYGEAFPAEDDAAWKPGRPVIFR